VDLEEKHRQANVTIKEKEFFISNLLKSGETPCTWVCFFFAWISVLLEKSSVKEFIFFQISLMKDAIPIVSFFHSCMILGFKISCTPINQFNLQDWHLINELVLLKTSMLLYLTWFILCSNDWNLKFIHLCDLTLCVIDFLPMNFVNLSEKGLVERAFELRSELENAASDVSSLFTKIGLYWFQI